MAYIIKATYRTGGDDEGSYNILQEWGDFRSTIDYTVHLEGNENTRPTGIIVQKIEKSTRVEIYDNNGGGLLQLLQTTQDIHNYTSGNVSFMNDNYLEVFNVAQGVVVDEEGNAYGDQFQNGAICEYENGAATCDDELDMSIGEILQTGECVFILNTNPIFNRIIHSMLPGNRATAANGLPYLPSPNDDELWTIILREKNSYTYMHEVRLNWIHLNIIRQDRSKLFVDHFFQVTNVSGGARKHTKRKKRRKLKKNTRKK